MSENNHLTINGSGSYAGGSYNKVIIRGEGTITDHVECKVCKIYGTGDMHKDVSADFLSVFGETEIGKSLKAEKISILGTILIGGKASIGKTKVFGTIDIHNGFTGEQADIKGTLSVNGDAELETLMLSGGFEVAGLLSADTIDIGLRFGTSKAQEIGGERIKVRKKNPFFASKRMEGSLEAKIIEGDDIYLENTHADTVRGNHVQIGAGCVIGLVEYKNTYKASADSAVKEFRKV
ncbi:cytoplasmic protein [Bacillus sp. 03113]|uniref:cytoplasmic protein n=1 Tax=Bacillus sp. 03113 TaxID=2578211 RepID=UPI00114148A0|nr:cytoplasmic protein [Bacillus sp. 03113]